MWALVEGNPSMRPDPVYTLNAQHQGSMRLPVGMEPRTLGFQICRADGKPETASPASTATPTSTPIQTRERRLHLHQHRLSLRSLGSQYGTYCL